MRLIKITEEFVAGSEDEAIAALEKFRTNQATEHYQLGANGYKYKTKKAKKEVVDEAWIVTVTKIFGEVWE